MPETLARPASVGAAVAWGSDVLAAAGCDTPRLDAELLLASALGVGRERLVLDHGSVVPGRVAEAFDRLVSRRAAREPVAYILGQKEFRWLGLSVDRRVLIPRPETELLVEAGLSVSHGGSVADVGTGSGAVALALKDERPDLVVRGLDVSADAVTVARENAARLGLDVEFACCDLLDDGAYDAVLANLPYVSDHAVLAPEISLYEPRRALLGGVGGLDVITRLVAAAAGRAGLLALEIDPAQAGSVGELVTAAGFARVEVLRDLAGRERVVVGTA